MKLKRIAAWGLAITMALSLDIPSVNAASGVGDSAQMTATISDEDRQAQIKTATEDQMLPGTTRTFYENTEEENIREWFNVSGYAADGVQDRSEYYAEYLEYRKGGGKRNYSANYYVVEEDGYWNSKKEYLSKEEYEGLGAEEKGDYKEVSAEEQFTAALNAKPKVIQVNAEELELGYYYLDRNKIPKGTIEQVTDSSNPQTNPVLMQEFAKEYPEQGGMGLSDIKMYNHLTMFSTTGCIIRHAGLDLGGCDDVIIRNFQFEGMYEWDDNKVSLKEDGTFDYVVYTTRKRYGWCNVSLNNSNDIWVDHCTFGFAFDGNIDLKNGSRASITWCKFGVQDLDTAGEEQYQDTENLPKWNESKGSELWKNILYMEECYQAYKNKTAKECFEDYVSLREKGVSLTEILNYAALHSKVHLVGSGDKDLYTSVNEKISLGFDYYTNVIQRIPMVRSGNGHMYNCIVDNTDFQDNIKKMQAKGVKGSSLDKAMSEDATIYHFYSGYVSVNNARNGATIGTDTSVFINVTPNCGAEKQGLDLGNVTDGWNSLVTPMVNHNLTVNSKVTIDNKTYTGSSWDKAEDRNQLGDNLFNDKKWTWDDRSSIGDFKWSYWEGLDYFLENDTTVDTNKISPRMLAYGANFYKDFYVGQYELEYAYKCFKLNEVEDILLGEDKESGYCGAQKNLYGAEETALDYIQPYNSKVMKEEYKVKATIYTDGVPTNPEEFVLNGDEENPIILKDGGTYFLKDGESLTLPTAKEIPRTGYIFKGWAKRVYADGQLGELSGVLTEDSNDAVTIKTGDAYVEEIYYPVWEAIRYELSFNSMGGTPVDSIFIPYDKSINSVGFPPNPTKEGATFKNWCNFTPDPEVPGRGHYGSIIGGTTKLKADTTAYARWTNTVTLVNAEDGSKIGERKVDSENTVATTGNPLADPEKEGCVFAGWYSDEDLTKPFDVMADQVWEPMTLYAKFRPKEQTTVTVTFVTNMDDVTIDKMEVEIGVTGGAILAQIDTPLDPDGVVVFDGWYTDMDCTKAFKEDAVIENDLILYAKWKSKDNILLGDMNGNGKRESIDALAILDLVAAGKTDPKEYPIANVDQNEKIDALDALKLLDLIAAGKVSKDSE